MSNFKEILERINSVVLISQMSKTMKMISISKLMKYQNTLTNLRSFYKRITEINKNVNISYDLEFSQNKNIDQSTLIIPIGSNKGFCGAFNNNIYKSIRNILSEDKTVMPIGKKMLGFISKHKTNIISENVDILKHVSLDNINRFSDSLYDLLETQKYSNIIFIYNKFISASTQEVFFEEIKFDQKIIKDTNEKKCEIIYESTPIEINNFLKKKILFYKILNIIYESMCSENASTMISMNKASDNADKIIKSLKTMYNQTRQASITNEITEISAGAKFSRK